MPNRPVRSQSGTVSSMVSDETCAINGSKRSSRKLPRNFSGDALQYESDVASSPPQYDSPTSVRKRLPSSPRCRQNVFVGDEFQFGASNEFNERKTSNPLHQSMSSSDIIHRQRLTRRISERVRTRSDKDLYLDHQYPNTMPTTPNVDSRSKSVSPYPYVDDAYDRQHTNAYNRFESSPLNDRLKRRRGKTMGGSCKARGETWKFRSDVS